jgi:hypothetical protein
MSNKIPKEVWGGGRSTEPRMSQNAMGIERALRGHLKAREGF